MTAGKQLRMLLLLGVVAATIPAGLAQVRNTPAKLVRTFGSPSAAKQEEANGVSLSYSSLPPYYQQRDKEGRLGPPEEEVVFGETLQNAHKLTAKAKGRTLECPPVWQDVAYYLNDSGERGRRVAIFGYRGCPFALEDDLNVVTNMEMRVETRIVIDSASDDVLWVAEESARPLASTGASLVSGCEMLVNIVWVFKNEGITFAGKSERYQVERAGATIRFTRQGVVLDGVEKLAGTGSDSKLEDGVGGVGAVSVKATQEEGDPNEFTTEMDKVSYIIGTQIANNFKAQGIEVNIELLIRGLRETTAGQKSPFTEAEQNKIMMDFQQKMIAKLKAQQEHKETQAMDKLGQDKAWKLKMTKPELMEFDPNKDYFWVLETNKGNIRIKLMPDVAPMHVTSTIFLTQKGFYNDTIFHRVITGFMAQGGDPLGTGTGGPGYQYQGEFKPNVKHDRPYLLSMANAGPGTDGSQFFITFKPTPWLDGKHTIFGEVVEGQETVKKLEAAGTQQGKPKEELKILKAGIDEKAKG